MKQIAEMSTEEILKAYSNHTPAVYLIGNKDFWCCKIGKSFNPWLRVYDLDRPKLPFQLEVLAIVRVGEADDWVERKLHKAFSHRKMRGEWFRMINAGSFTRKAKALHNAYLKGER